MFFSDLYLNNYKIFQLFGIFVKTFVIFNDMPTVSLYLIHILWYTLESNYVKKRKLNKQRIEQTHGIPIQVSLLVPYIYLYTTKLVTILTCT